MWSVIACPACDLLHRQNEVPVKGRTVCVRCRAPLQRAQSATIATAVALGICALIFFILCNAYPLVSMHINGVTRSTTLLGAAGGLYAQGEWTLAALVVVTTVIAPLLQILCLFYVLLPLWRNQRARGQTHAYRLLNIVRPWSLMEVFMLGALAALVRLAHFAVIVPGISLWSCGLLMLSLSALTNFTSPEQYWRWVDRHPT